VPNSEQVDLLTMKLTKQMVRLYRKVLVSTSRNHPSQLTVFLQKVKLL